MFPQLPSHSEVYGKHRDPEQLKQMERQNQVLEARAHQYGDPVQSSHSPSESPRSEWSEKQDSQTSDQTNAGDTRRRGILVRLAALLFGAV